MKGDSKSFLNSIYKLLNNHFDLEEIKNLCFEINVDFDSLPGEGKVSKIRELIQHFARQKLLPNLLRVVRKDRPLVDWPSMPPNFRYTPDQAIGDQQPQAKPAPTFNLGDIQASIVNVGGEQTISGSISVDMREVRQEPQLNLSLQIQQIRKQLEEGSIKNQKAKILINDLLGEFEQLPKAEDEQAKKILTRLQALLAEFQEDPPDQEMLALTVQSLKRTAAKLKADQSEIMSLIDLLTNLTL